MSEQEWPKVPKSYLTREHAASVLGIKEEEVRRLGRQGRLEASTEGSENRYETSSVLRFRAEELIRAMLDRARERCPELCEQIEELASIQYQRGAMAGLARMGEEALSRYPKLDEALRSHRIPA